MVSITLRQLRDTKQVKTWLKAGVAIEVRERNSVLGRFVPNQPELKPTHWPDYAARRKALFGDLQLNAVQNLIDSREDRF